MPIELPPLFVSRVEKLLPAHEMPDFLSRYEEDFTPSLRINLLKTSLQEFQSFFSLEALKNAVPWLESGFFIERKSLFTKTPFYHAGLFYVQEASSMLPAVLLDPEPGDFVLDVCASPGSKTTQILTQMNHQGLLIANEIRRDRVGRLMENVIRWGARNTVITNQASSCFSPLTEFFDKILVDAPCSGEGMFKKDPDALKCWSLQNVKTCASTQKQILREVIPALKTGGRLVYSTCTLSPEENEEIVDWILKTYPGCFVLEPIEYGSPGILSFEGREYDPEVQKTCRLWHHRTESEGFFAASLKKTASTPSSGSLKPATRRFIQTPTPGLMKDFLKQIPARDFENAFQIGYRVYSWASLPKEDLEGLLHHLKPVYLGVHLGDEKKNRIEPEHPLALSLSKTEAKNWPGAELNEEQATAYLRGQEIKLPGFKEKGFHLACYQGFPLGFGKISEGRLKNLFPKSLRHKL